MKLVVLGGKFFSVKRVDGKLGVYTDTDIVLTVSHMSELYNIPESSLTLDLKSRGYILEDGKIYFSSIPSAEDFIHYYGSM